MNVPLGRIFGTEIRAHWTWVPILAFIAVVFSLDLTAGGGSDWPPALAWAASITMATTPSLGTNPGADDKGSWLKQAGASSCATSYHS